MLSFTAEAKQRLGPVRINRFRSDGIKIDGQIWRGADFFRNVDRYLTKTMMNEVGGRASASDLRDITTPAGEPRTSSQSSLFGREREDA
jgi:hypothetical protein